MKVLRGKDVPVRDEAGEKRVYHLFDQAEIIITHLPPAHTQPFRRHREISELYYVLEGTITAYEGNTSWTLEEGDSFLLTPSSKFHTVSNQSKRYAKIATIKLKPAPETCPELFQRDKETPSENASIP